MEIMRLLRNQLYARYPRHWLLESYRKRLNEKALRVVQKQSFWPLLRAYREQSQSTGADYWDYLCLYNIVRTLRPLEVLECGTGISTVVLAAALEENDRDGHGRGHLTSMEDQEKWHGMAVKLFPERLKKYADIMLSPRVEYVWGMFRGVGYKDIPTKRYTLVFVDGPDTDAPSDGLDTFDFDYINVVLRSDLPVYGIVDGRVVTCRVFQGIFGMEKVKYDLVSGLGFVGPCLRNDLENWWRAPYFAYELRRSRSVIATWSLSDLLKRATSFYTHGNNGRCGPSS